MSPHIQEAAYFNPALVRGLQARLIERIIWYAVVDSDESICARADRGQVLSPRRTRLEIACQREPIENLRLCRNDKLSALRLMNWFDSFVNGFTLFRALVATDFSLTL